jgi:Ni,Fe-hydrogenase III large subunit/Ni,Fe-hydrogenase III component G
MASRRWFQRATIVAGAPGARGLVVTPDAWRQAVRDLTAGAARLVSIWAESDVQRGHVVKAAFAVEPGLLVLSLQVPGTDGTYPGIEEFFPAAGRMQRAIHDLHGLRSTDPDSRPWLRHASWPAGCLPLEPAHAPGPPVPATDHYAFVRVAGDGVHEVPVGPVHAGIIEPGHFRFSIVGEKVLRLEERLGYVHKGIERRFTELGQAQGHRLAARVCGDSTVAFSWAYCQALEGAAGISPPPRAAWLRALALESERIANHLGDLGALGNDAGFAFALAQFSRLKEHWLRAVNGAFGQRYLMDYVVPGGTVVDVDGPAGASLAAAADVTEREARALRATLDEHAGVRDRFFGTGVVAPELASRLGLTGLAGRASGQAFDLRVDLPSAPYDQLAPRKAGSNAGDVAARVAVRFDELFESCRLVRAIVQRAPAGPHACSVEVAGDGSTGVGVVEGWRGPVLVALTAGAAGAIRRCHPHDPSWLNWPVIEHAVIGNIVPDFPLINKSFNLSYSGHDL